MRSHAPTLREIHGFTAPRAFWNDPDLAPPVRTETPLSAFIVSPPPAHKETSLAAFA